MIRKIYMLVGVNSGWLTRGLFFLLGLILSIACLAALKIVFNELRKT